MSIEHASLTGASLHEPKGVASAAANTVYAADGVGSGTWTDPNTLITATNFTTGDAKLTFKTTADSGWVMMNDGTIGDSLSSATTRANDDCEDLFTLFWTNISNANAAVSGGRGASAAADWAAHKTIALPKELGRALVIAGAGSGLTSRTLGGTAGAETVSIAETNLPSHTHTTPSSTTSAGSSHQHTGTTNSHTHPFNTPNFQTIGISYQAGASSFSVREYAGNYSSDTTSSTAVDFTTNSEGSHTHSVNAGVTGATGSGTALANVQPSSFINIMVKL